MIVRVRRWGNSLAVRLRSELLAKAGISEGDLVRVEVTKASPAKPPGGDAIPTFEDPDPKASIHHDRYLYG